MKHIFSYQRNFLKAVRPIANRVAPFELPADSYFLNIRDLFGKLEGVDEIMEDPNTTSVRLVTNPEKMVLRETERAFVYFSLHGLTVDAVIVNRLLPSEVSDAWFNEWQGIPIRSACASTNSRRTAYMATRFALELKVEGRDQRGYPNVWLLPQDMQCPDAVFSAAPG